MRLPHRFAVCIVLVISSLSLADTAKEQRIERIQNGLLPAVLVKGDSTPLPSLSARMEAFHVPGVSVAVIHDGKLEWARGFGVTRAGGPPVTPETLFQAASISKLVSAMAVLKLVQDGELNLDMDVNQYLKTWKIPENDFTQQAKVTLRGLLTHSAGVTVHGFLGYEAGLPVPSVVQVLDGQPPANNSPIRVDQVPGKSWRYSGGGYVVAQQVVTDVTGVAFPKIMHDWILLPLGMKRSTYEQPLPGKLLAQAATPYRVDGTPVKGGPHTYPELAAASLWTTPSDLARYAIAVQKSLAGKPKQVLSQETAHAMLTPSFNGHGLGPVAGGSAEHPYFQHGGANEGYRCLLVAYQVGDGAVIMTNSDNGLALIPEIMRTIAYEYGWPDFKPTERTLADIAPESFDRHVGAFRMGSGAVVTFWRDGSHINSRLWGQPVVELFPMSDREYFAKTVDAHWEFSDDPDKAETAILYQNGQKLPAKKLDDTQGRSALDLSIAAEKRFKQQTPATGSEAVLRRLIDGLASGKPNYDEMGSELADLTRRMLTELQAAISRFGAIQAVSFKGVGPAGADIYDVKFDHDTREFRIILDGDGRISMASFSP